MSWLLEGLRDRETATATGAVGAGFSSVAEFLADSELRNFSPMMVVLDMSKEKSRVRPVSKHC